MADRLCPKCGNFALKLVPGKLPGEDKYVCSCCGYAIPAPEMKGVSLNENTMNRFPTGADATPSSALGSFTERKKQ